MTLFSAGIVLTDLILSNFIFGTRPYSFEYFVGNTLFGIIAFHLFAAMVPYKAKAAQFI